MPNEEIIKVTKKYGKIPKKKFINKTNMVSYKVKERYTIN